MREIKHEKAKRNKYSTHRIINCRWRIFSLVFWCRRTQVGLNHSCHGAVERDVASSVCLGRVANPKIKKRSRARAVLSMLDSFSQFFFFLFLFVSCALNLPPVYVRCLVLFLFFSLLDAPSLPLEQLYYRQMRKEWEIHIKEQLGERKRKTDFETSKSQ